MTIELNLLATVALAVVVLFIGNILKKHVPIFDKYCIPAPVIGGILFSILTLIFHLTNVLTLTLDTTLQSVFMTLFFTSVGYSASFKLLKKGGILTAIVVASIAVLIVIQDIIGVSVMSLFGEHPFPCCHVADARLCR